MTETAPLPPMSPTSPPTTPWLTSWLQRLRHFRRSWLYIATFLAVIGILGLSLFLVDFTSAPFTSPSPLPTLPPTSPTPAPSVSPLATDSAIIKLQTDLDTLKQQLDQTDLEERSLLPPALDLNFTIE